MKKITALLLTGFTVAGISCSFMKSTFQEPKDEKRIIVVGSIAIDLFEYRNITKTYRSDVQVIIAGRYRKNGKVVHKNYWATTDDRGYFFLANVPEGDYALRGFRFQTVGPSFYLTVINPLKTEKDKFMVTRTAKLPDAAFVFKYPVINRIVNLRHNYFILDRGKTVHQRVYYRLENLRLVTGKTLVEPDVVSYFAGKYPRSAWFKK
ncbi:MAG TPA: hypothetical protein ENH29_06220 [Bacteroidetes bacterium]|nr:hypothetical protein [Bacteroidota bacterium]